MLSQTYAVGDCIALESLGKCQIVKIYKAGTMDVKKLITLYPLVFKYFRVTGLPEVYTHD